MYSVHLQLLTVTTQISMLEISRLKAMCKVST